MLPGTPAAALSGIASCHTHYNFSSPLSHSHKLYTSPAVFIPAAPRSAMWHAISQARYHACRDNLHQTPRQKLALNPAPSSSTLGFPKPPPSPPCPIPATRPVCPRHISVPPRHMVQQKLALELDRDTRELETPEPDSLSTTAMVPATPRTREVSSGLAGTMVLPAHGATEQSNDKTISIVPVPPQKQEGNESISGSWTPSKGHSWRMDVLKRSIKKVMMKTKVATAFKGERGQLPSVVTTSEGQQLWSHLPHSGVRPEPGSQREVAEKKRPEIKGTQKVHKDRTTVFTRLKCLVYAKCTTVFT